MHDRHQPEKRNRKKKYVESPESGGKILNILDAEQRKGYGVIEAHALTILLGEAGTGKTLLAVYYALDKLLKDEIQKIIITRPTFSEHTIGFLPGTVNEKMMLYVMPMVANMYRCIDQRSKIEYFMRSGIIEIIPQEFIRGVTINDGVMIVDEAQNCNNKELKTIGTRIGVGGKLIICGDKNQVDLRDSKYSGLQRLVGFAERQDERDAAVYELHNNHRHPVVQRLVKYYEGFPE